MLDHYRRQYENLIVIGYFNCEVDEVAISCLVNSYDLTNLVRNVTCFKSDSPRCIDLILTNRKSSFKGTVAIETRRSDFHVMIFTVLKGGYVKRRPKIVTYPDYSRFGTVDCNSRLAYVLACGLGGSEDYGALKLIVISLLNEHAPVKKKYIRASDGPFMTKALRKENMHRTKLRNKYNDNKTEEKLKAFKKQRNKCVKLLRKAKFDHYQNIDLSNLTDNHIFLKTVKPLFSDKVQVNSAITLIEDGKLVKESEIVEIFNHFFANITESLGISTNESLMLSADDIQDPIDRAIRKFDSRPSICKVEGNTTSSKRFEFREVAVEDVAVQIRKLETNKASPINSIPPRIPKEILTYFRLPSKICSTLVYPRVLFPEN